MQKSFVHDMILICRNKALSVLKGVLKDVFYYAHNYSLFLSLFLLI